jgi:hypothetical protein
MEPSIYEPLIRGDDTVFTPEQQLWIHVVMQAVIDAASPHPAVKKEIVDWLKSEDFEIVCDMAGMSHIEVRKRLHAVFSAPTQAESFRTAMNFRFLIRAYVEDNLADVDKKKHTD